MKVTKTLFKRKNLNLPSEKQRKNLKKRMPDEGWTSRMRWSGKLLKGAKSCLSLRYLRAFKIKNGRVRGLVRRHMRWSIS